MMPSISPEVLVPIITVIFGAGGILAALRSKVDQSRKDINAIGMNTRRERWNKMLWEMVVTEKREDRQRLADLMREQ